MLLLDNSAWSHLNGARLDRGRQAEIMAWMADGAIATCLPFLLEAGYSARSAADRQAMMSDFELLTRIEITSDVERQALQAQRELAEVGHHRPAPVDVMIAACAHHVGAGVLHYDRDYDLIATHTTLRFESEWLAPPGAL